MPYNSKAFEQQLAKYRNKQIASEVSKLPDGHHRSTDRAFADKSAVKPSVLDSQDIPVSRAAQKRLKNTTMEVPEGMRLVRQKPFFQRTMTKVVMLGIVAGVVISVFFRPQLDEVMDRILGAEPAVMAENATSGGVAAVEGNTPTGSLPSIPSTSDFNQAIKDAQAKAAAVANQGPVQSMQYIQDESKRLQDMAKDLGAKAGPTGGTPNTQP